MTKTIQYPILSISFFVGIVFVLTLCILTLIPQNAHAQSANIIEGVDLQIGSRGTDVALLQGLLQEMGYMNILPRTIPLGYYGTLTKAAVVKYQTARDVSPATGVFDWPTRRAMHIHFGERGWLSLLGW